jgi:hypothetical protein
MALYYPWRHFQDEDWLKLAVLAWDKIARVRPRGLPDNDHPVVRQLRVGTNARWEDDERWRMASSNAISPSVGIPVFDLYAGPADPMISTEFCDLLSGLDLVVLRRAGKNGEHRWVSVRRRLGSAYLACLADVMARRNLLSPVTDSPGMHRAFGALDRLPEMLFGDDNPPYGLEDAASGYLHVALDAVLEPRRLADVPTATLIAFRERYRDQLALFRQQITELSAELQSIAAVENPEVTRAHLEALYERTTRPQLDELRKGPARAGHRVSRRHDGHEDQRPGRRRNGPGCHRRRRRAMVSPRSSRSRYPHPVRRQHPQATRRTRRLPRCLPARRRPEAPRQRTAPLPARLPRSPRRLHSPPVRWRAFRLAGMAYDTELADRIRFLIGTGPGVTEKKMFGGLAFLIGGNMAISASGKGGALVRVDPAQAGTLVATTNAVPAVMAGRTMAGWLRVSSDDLQTDEQLTAWISRAVAYARSLPPKR